MPIQQLRRALLAAACALPLVIAACGGGGNDIVSEFKPQRVVVFGDSFADAGQRGGLRYTVNDSNAVNWTQQLASRYEISLTPSSAGGTSYAIGSARVTGKPDAQGNAATPTIADQISAVLNGGGVSADDLVIVSGGLSDIIFEMRAFTTGVQTEAQMVEKVKQAGRDLGTQVRRLVQSGATHVVVVGAYNLGRSPWAGGTGQNDLLESLSNDFNDELKVAIVELGTQVLYVDAALYFNLVTASAANALGYGFSDVQTMACNSVDPGLGIGIGPGWVSSLACDGGDLVSTSTSTWLFADPVYFTPHGHSQFGTYAYDRVHERW